MHDVANEFACAVGCAVTISANVLKVKRTITFSSTQTFFAALFCVYGDS